MIANDHVNVHGKFIGGMSQQQFPEAVIVLGDHDSHSFSSVSPVPVALQWKLLIYRRILRYSLTTAAVLGWQLSNTHHHFVMQRQKPLRQFRFTRHPIHFLLGRIMKFQSLKEHILANIGPLLTLDNVAAMLSQDLGAGGDDAMGVFSDDAQSAERFCCCFCGCGKEASNQRHGGGEMVLG